MPATVVAPASTLQTFDSFNNTPLAVDGFGSVFTTFQPWAQSIYHSGSVGLIHRFTKGLYFRANYTFAKTIDDGTNELFTSRVNPRRAEDGLNTPLERGLSALNIPQKFTMTWVYELPTLSRGNAFVRGVANGWEVSGTYLAQKGQPITALSGSDANANGDVAGDRTILNPQGVGMTGSTVSAVSNNGAGVGQRGSSLIRQVLLVPATETLSAIWLMTRPPDTSRRSLERNRTWGATRIQTPGLNLWNISREDDHT